MWRTVFHHHISIFLICSGMKQLCLFCCCCCWSESIHKMLSPGSAKWIILFLGSAQQSVQNSSFSFKWHFTQTPVPLVQCSQCVQSIEYPNLRGTYFAFLVWLIFYTFSFCVDWLWFLVLWIGAARMMKTWRRCSVVL